MLNHIDTTHCLPACDQITYEVNAKGRGTQESTNGKHVVYIYFKDMSFTEIKQSASYQIDRLLGDLGGYMGLLLGASAITLMEILDLFTHAFLTRLQDVIRRKPCRENSGKDEEAAGGNVQ